MSSVLSEKKSSPGKKILSEFATVKASKEKLSVHSQKAPSERFVGEGYFITRAS